MTSFNLSNSKDINTWKQEDFSKIAYCGLFPPVGAHLCYTDPVQRWKWAFCIQRYTLSSAFMTGDGVDHNFLDANRKHICLIDSDPLLLPAQWDA